MLEDAGLEATLRAGPWVSRLFEPAIRLELGTGWFRRDAGTAEHFELRHGSAGAEGMSIRAGIDFLQCGRAPLVAEPSIDQVLAGITTMPLLTTTAPRIVRVGNRTGSEVRLAGGGDPVPEEDFLRSNEFGCVLSSGDVPFPSESSWEMLMPDTVRQLILIDVEGTTVLVVGRTDDTDGLFFDLVVDVLATTSLGDGQPAST